MNTNQKNTIQIALRTYIERYASQNAAANSLNGVSSATISQILNGKTELVASQMWQKIASQIGILDASWQSATTQNYVEIHETIAFASEHSQTIALIGGAGAGKSHAAKEYAQKHRTAIYIQCDDYWNRRHFLEEILRSMGIDYKGLGIPEMVKEIVRNIIILDKPVLILDEADKLNDNLMYFIITLYNKLEDNCGIVLMATSFLKIRFEKGRAKNKKGYAEMYSRIGNKFMELDAPTNKCISQICQANGLEDPLKVSTIKNKSDADLRSVKRLVKASKID